MEEKQKHESRVQSIEEAASSSSGSKAHRQQEPRGLKRAPEASVEEAGTERTERVEDDAPDEVRAISPDTTVEYDSDHPVELDLGVFVGNWEVAVGEVYSRPRVLPFAERMGFRGISSMDLTMKDEFGRA